MKDLKPSQELKTELSSEAMKILRLRQKKLLYIIGLRGKLLNNLPLPLQGEEKRTHRPQSLK